MIMVEVSNPFLYIGKLQQGEGESKLTELVSDKARSVNTSLDKVKTHAFCIISDAFLWKDSV